MIDQTKTEQLHTGLLTLDRKALISPSTQYPDLFTDPYEQNIVNSTESRARTALAARGINVSTERILLSHPETNSKGYLLRESARVAIEACGFETFSHEEVVAYIEGSSDDVKNHFLLQVASHIKPRRQIL